MNLLLRNLKTLLFPRRYRAELADADRMLRAEAEAVNGAAERIRGFLASDAWEVRNCAVKIIARTRCEELYDVLRAKLLERGEAGIVRRNCAELIPLLGPAAREMEDALRRALADPYWEVRAEAARAFAGTARPSAGREAVLLERLEREENLEVRAAQAQALGGLGVGRAALAALARLAGDGPWLVRHQAAVGLLELGARVPELSEEAVEHVRGLDLLAEGAATRSVFRQGILDLIELTAPGRPFPPAESLRRRYFHLKWGWLKRR
jgi:HEAT repeat protein